MASRAGTLIAMALGLSGLTGCIDAYSDGARHDDVVVGALLPYSPLARLLGFVPLPASFFGFLAAVSATYLVLVEGVKRLLLRRAAA